MAEWFKDWFNTKYYHILYKSRDYSEAEKFIQTLVEDLALEEQAFILDLACGRGRHAIFLNKLGYKVHGIDLSPESIKVAKESETDGLTFQVKDMRETVEKGKFDAVFNLFTSFGYFNDLADNQKVIEAVKETLKPNGLLLIDFLNMDCVRKNLIAEESKTLDGIEFNLKKQITDQHIIKDIRFEAEGEAHHYVEKVQTLYKHDFEKMLSSSGFEIEAVYGDYKLATFVPQLSPRLIIKARLK